MKTAILLIFVLSGLAQAMPADTRDYAFRFQPFAGETYQYQTKATTQEEAYERAATACFLHYKKGRRISMDVGVEIIDICANPRNI
jgi:hypothetical protein